MTANTVEKWQHRVAAWRASGQTAEAFSVGRAWAANTLRWWASRLGPERAAQRPRAATSVVRVAQVVRVPVTTTTAAPGAIVVEARDARVRIVIASGAAADTVSAVLRAVLPTEAR